MQATVIDILSPDVVKRKHNCIAGLHEEYNLWKAVKVTSYRRIYVLILFFILNYFHLNFTPSAT